MYICVCHAVTDSDIHQAAKNGAQTLKDLRRDLRVSQDCGLCASFARQCLKSAKGDSEHSQQLGS